MKRFDALDWVAAIFSQRGIDSNGFSNVCRGKGKKEDQEELIPCILEPGRSYKKR